MKRLIKNHHCIIGADDWTLKHESKLPDYYIEYKEAEKLGFKNFLGNLSVVVPDRMITRGVY